MDKYNDSMIKNMEKDTLETTMDLVSGFFNAVFLIKKIRGTTVLINQSIVSCKVTFSKFVSKNKKLLKVK
ncbi:hypothetical protein [Lacicoccus qingdaonensis]|uniref:hypothetical protein n=1 Tax=Lacicoccus qingdaonensis TaxID=576118 RepID=UPI000B885453|nr:hypothetical protein [Salinicoccus qingdaonensis]